MNQISVKQEELASQLKLCVQILLILMGLVVILLVILLFYSNISSVPSERLVENVLQEGSKIVENMTESASKTEM